LARVCEHVQQLKKHKALHKKHCTSTEA